MRALTSRHGYAIPCRWDWQGQKQVVIICHGFGSSKDSPMAQAVAAEGGADIQLLHPQLQPARLVGIFEREQAIARSLAVLLEQAGALQAVRAEQLVERRVVVGCGEWVQHGVRIVKLRQQLAQHGAVGGRDRSDHRSVLHNRKPPPR